MSIKRKIKIVISNKYENIHTYFARKNEINKFKNKKRVAIYSKIILTNEQKRKIDNLYEKNYGRKIPYIWHRHFTAFTGNFDENYFPELLYIPEFERFENLDKAYAKVFSDKNILPLIAKFVGIKMPETYFCCQAGLYKDGKNNILNYNDLINNLLNIGECFIKPTVDTDSGMGCQLLNVCNGIDKNSGQKIEDIIKLKSDNWVIQENIICHNSIRKIYEKGVNTFRIMTYRWKDNIEVVPIVMRIGQRGSYLDNAHAGGMFIAIDNDGTMHEKAFTEFKDEFVEHPDSGLKFQGYKIELLPEVIQNAINMHIAMPNIGVVNWDFTINNEGKPVLIEANLKGGGIWIFEMAHGKGIFGSKTSEILKWMKLMKNTKASERYRYAFGKSENQ